ncbi:MAG: hypothetical protein U1E62_03530 [Alsobacter sp.]
MTQDDLDPARLAVAAALLAQGRHVDALSRILTAGGLLGTPVLATILSPAALVPVLLFVALGLTQAWLALRVGFDAALFEAVSRPGWESCSALDAALMEQGLLPPAKAGRPLAPRIAGARRLLIWQAVLLVLQVALALAVSLLLVWMGR